jgi:hypothetical protein
VKPVWHDYTHHEFCERMGDGTLPREAFKNYMIQDYLYLVIADIPASIPHLLTQETDPIRSSQRSGKLQVHISRRHCRSKRAILPARARHILTMYRARRSSHTSGMRSISTSKSAHNSVSHRKIWRSMKRVRVCLHLPHMYNSITHTNPPQLARHTVATSSTSGNRKIGSRYRSLYFRVCSATA